MRSKSVFLHVLLGTLLCSVTRTGLANGAQIIGVYENCRFANVTVIVQNLAVPSSASAEAEMAAAGSDSFSGATQAAKSVLKHYGVKDVKVEQRGYEGCARPASGKFIEALGHYCEGKLIRAEILIDGKVFASRTDEKLSFDDFVDRQRKRLRQQGILDKPKVTVQNEQNCAPPNSS